MIITSCTLKGYLDRIIYLRDGKKVCVVGGGGVGRERKVLD